MFMYKQSRINHENIHVFCVNACGLNSKLKYTILHDYRKQFDAICLTENKSGLISDNEINGFKSCIMHQKTRNTNMGVFMAYACL